MASEKLFQEIPPFPNDIATAEMRTISLEKLSVNDQQEADNLFEACRELGFFLLDLNSVGLGQTMINEIDEIWGYMKILMNLPNEVKTKYLHDFPKTTLGFKPLGEGKTETMEADRFSWFNLGRDGLLGTTPRQSVPEVIDQHRDTFVSFLEHGQTVLSTMCQVLAKRLNISPAALAAIHSTEKESGTVIRFIKSEPSLTASDLRTSMVHHTDFGTVTMLANVVGGLQILKPGKAPSDADGWLYARPRPGCLIMNLGDAMVQLTGGILRSNCHRVYHAPGAQACVDRYSLAISVRPEKGANMRKLVDSHSTAWSKDVQDKDMTVWEWEIEKMRALRNGEHVMNSKGGNPILANA